MTLDELIGGGAGVLTPAEYERRIAKLAKINAALMQRVERSMDQQANAFSLFQAAIGLEAQVRLRTDELRHALDRLAETNEELVAARDASDRANRVKTRFFTAVGHDLLQPLHAARLSLSALSGPQTRGASGETAGNARLLGQIDHALITVEELLKTVLDLSKLESGVLTPTLENVPLQRLFDGLVADLSPIARDKGLLFTCRRTDALVESDAMMLRRMVQNLLANAVRYTERGEIKLAARRRGAFVRIEVWDTGPGIAPEERSRIFEEFQRGAASDRAGVSGFGLGLSIVQRMSEALQHRITLCSREGHGTRFSILAPFAGTLDPLQPVLPAPSTSPSPAESVSLAGRRIVVIDNDMAILTAMDALLESWGCEHRLARHIEELDDILAQDDYRPDVVIADYHLDHDETGVEAVTRIRGATQSDLPAIVVTADHSEAIDTAARAARCEVLRKPVRPAELRALMQHLLS